MTPSHTPQTSRPTVPPASVGPHGALTVQCSARAKSTGERCRRAPIRGGAVCIVHGGKAPQVVAAAKRRREAAQVEYEVRGLLAFTSYEGVCDPLEALALLADESLAFKEALASRVNDLAGQIRYKASGAGTEQLRAEVALYERAMDRTGRLLDALARSGFEERRTQLAEQQGLLVVEALRRIFDRLALTEEQRALVPTVVPEELRRISGPSVPGEVVRR